MWRLFLPFIPGYYVISSIICLCIFFIWRYYTFMYSFSFQGIHTYNVQENSVFTLSAIILFTLWQCISYTLFFKKKTITDSFPADPSIIRNDCTKHRFNAPNICRVRPVNKANNTYHAAASTLAHTFIHIHS